MTDLAPLNPGAAVLVAGAGITGRALLATLQPLGARATLTDDSPAALQSLRAVRCRRRRPGRGRRPHHRLRPRRSPAPGSRPPRRCWPPRPRPACRSGAMSSWPGGWMPRAGSVRRGAGWSSPGPTARPPPPRCCTRCWWRPAAAACCAAISAARCSTCWPSRPTCWPSSCRVSNCTGHRRCGRRPGWCSMSPRTTSTGTARWMPTPATRRACWTAGWRSSGSTTRWPPVC